MYLISNLPVRKEEVWRVLQNQKFPVHKFLRIQDGARLEDDKDFFVYIDTQDILNLSIHFLGFQQEDISYIRVYHHPGQIIATSAEVTLNGGLVRESPPKSPYFRFRNYSNLPRSSQRKHHS